MHPQNLGTRPNPNGGEDSRLDLTFSTPDLADRTNINLGPYCASYHSCRSIASSRSIDLDFDHQNFWSIQSFWLIKNETIDRSSKSIASIAFNFYHSFKKLSVKRRQKCFYTIVISVNITRCVFVVEIRDIFIDKNAKRHCSLHRAWSSLKGNFFQSFSRGNHPLSITPGWGKFLRLEKRGSKTFYG